MPTPTDSKTTAQLRKLDWPLTIGAPVPEDVIQREAMNCALASILAAFANTNDGKTRIRRLITEKTERSQTTYDGDHFNPFEGPRELPSDRLFVLDLPQKPAQQVSDVFFTDESGPPHINMIYMAASRNLLWSSAIEKAYAALVGGYDNFSDDPTVVWQHLTGKAPQFLSLQKGTQNYHEKDKPYLDQARKAKQIPMIAAMANSYHGETVLGVDGNKISLYDPWSKKRTVTVSYLRSQMAVLYYGTP